MPVKRRKAVDPNAASPEPDAKRRVTRSSQRLAKKEKDPKEDDADTESNTKSTEKVSKPKAETKNKTGTKSAPKSTTTKKSKTTSATHPTPKPPRSSSPEENFQTLSINSPDVKDPIPCHFYPTPTSPKPSSSPSTLIFTHGAGGTLSAPAVQTFCTGFSKKLPVFAFQGSMNLGSRVKAFQACISHLGDSHTSPTNSGERKERRLILGGRSMGSRAAVLTAQALLSSSPPEDPPPALSLILVSYPLQGPKDVRDQILRDLPEEVDVLFVIGERDSMCPLEMLEDVRKGMKARSWVVGVEGLDHGMGGKGREALGIRSGEVAAGWVGGERWEGVKWLRVGEE